MACDQCGATYRVRATRASRLLTSWWLRLLVSFLLLGVMAQVLGVAVHLSLHRFAPGMFAGPHPLHLQSVAYRPEAQASAWSRAWVSRARSVWQLWGSSEDEDTSGDGFARLGVFHPAMVLQIVQGMIQRMLESLGRPFSLASLLRHRRGVPSLVQRVVTYRQGLGAAPPTPVVPLTWTEWLWWQTTLGLATMGLSVHFHSFSILSLSLIHISEPTD